MLPTKGLLSPKAFLSLNTPHSQNHYPLLTLQQQQQHLPPPPSPVFQVEEEEEVEQEGEGFMDLTSSTNDYKVFNQSAPSPNTPEDMGIKRKPQRSL